MAEYSGFFNSRELSDGSYDREYDASQFADYFSRFISNGVFGNPANNLQVVYSNDAEKPFNVTIRKGSAFIEGYWYELTEDMQLEIPANTQATQITNTVCCTLDKEERRVYIRLKEGVVSDLPERTTNIFDLVLSTITVKANASKINASDMIDRRPNNDYCGFVVGLVSQIETTELFNQYDSAFNEWFQKMKDQLTEDAAGNLQNQIDVIRTGVETNKSDIGTLSGSFIEDAASIFANTKQKKIASALAVKGLKSYTPMLPRSTYSGDLNDLPTGVYFVHFSDCTNTPEKSGSYYGNVLCWKNVVQIATLYTTNSAGFVAYRDFANNEWSKWKEQVVGIGFNNAWQKEHLKDGLNVNLHDPLSSANNTAFIANWESGIINLPSDCVCGVREVSWIDDGFIIVRITGYTVNTSIPATWVNVYANNHWVGWSKQTYGTGQITQSGLSIYSNRCKIISGGYYVQNKIAHVQMKIQALETLSSRNFWVMIRGLPEPAMESPLVITTYGDPGKSIGCYVEKTKNVASGELTITTATDGVEKNVYYIISGDYMVV